ncbi:MAG: sigma-70 family RNA polymerase sigma factor [Isosphaeraceae bacterium]|nr:sigma-70 family RNA polymerase sigma factor [Isosphaeraceae bacterium]
MSAEPLDRLIELLNSGDEAAAEQVFREYEPVLCALVRRRLQPALRSKFDTMDVVQSVWFDVVVGLRESSWHFADRAHLEAFLARLARNRLLDRCRKHRGAVQREVPLNDDASTVAATTQQPRPSQVAQRDELWDQMLALCPPAHHELLRLKRQGLRIAEIAARTGLHESSVRRIVYDLGRRFAAAREPARTAAVSKPDPAR